jgi:hypothetical protein
MRKYLVPLVLCLALAFCVNKHLDKSKKENAEKIANEIAEKKHRKNIKSLIMKYEANYKWYKLTESSNIRFPKPIIQADLEREWISKSPIIFFGNIYDYKNSSGAYRVVIHPSIFPIGAATWSVGLDVLAPRNVIDKLVAEHPDVLSRYPVSKMSAVAIIAKVEAVEPRWEGGGEEAEEVRYGVGTLLDAYYIDGRVLLDKDGKIY